MTASTSPVPASPVDLPPVGCRRSIAGFDVAAVRAVLGRDLGAVARSKAVVLPMILVPGVLLILLPLSVGLSVNGKGLQIDQFLGLLPKSLADPILAYPPDERLVILVLGYLVAPLFLILPLMVSAVLAGDAFAGEKERKTLETILHLPVRDRDLYVAKLLGSFAPAVAIAWIGFLVFAVVANVACWPVMHRLFLPTWLWAIVILWVAPAVAAVGLGVMVRVSIRVNTTQEAQQLGGAVVLPMVMLAVGQTTTLLLQGPLLALLVGTVTWVIAIWLNGRGAQAFTRDRMGSRI